MKKSLNIKSQPDLYIVNCKYKLEYLDKKNIFENIFQVFDIFQIKKKRKKLFSRVQIVLKMHN